MLSVIILTATMTVSPTETKPLVLHTVFLGSLVATSYRSVPRQTKPCPGCFYTSIGERVCRDGVAVSQDMLKDGRVKYGDWLFIGGGIGLKRVNDCMNARWKNRIDIWLETYEQEKAFDRRFRGTTVEIWRVEAH